MRTPAARTLSRLHKPANLSLEEWQAALRRQFGREQAFTMTNLGAEPVFSDFRVANPKSRSTYRVSIRGGQLGENVCACPDFATNTLGTCKHIEFVLARLERRRGGAAALGRGFEPPYSEVVLQYGAQRRVRFRPGRDCPPRVVALASEYFGGDDILLPEAFAAFETFLSQVARLGHDLRCHEDALAFVAEVRDRERREALIDKALPRGARDAAFRTLLRTDLYAYQREGALFAARAGRCLIGDEMGLGKTVQAIAAAEILWQHVGIERVLVVCPTSLKHQWEREIARFSGRPVTVVGGLRARRTQAFAQAAAGFAVTNYDTIHADLDLIADWAPDLVVLDEAQRIKNWNTRTARSVKRLASPYAIVLTGTPLENRLEELVSIVDFVDRHRLGPTFRLLADHQVRDEHGKVVGYRDLDRIGRTLSPVLLRRTKKEVLNQLPERIDKNYFVGMTVQQRQHHEENREVVGRIVAKWRRMKFLSEADQRRLMIALQNMRMSCDSTYLLDHETDFGLKADELTVLLGDVLEHPDAKVVVFSQWLRMHEVILRRLAGKPFRHVLFHGGIDESQRRALIDRFREDPHCRAFFSTDAGGVGLNLQHASVVVNMDLPWNPAVLEQRIGRVHRLGQRRPVRVVNFVAKGTIEEGMLSVLSFKKSLFAGVLDGGETEVFLGGSRLTRFMETVERTTGAIGAPAADDGIAEGAEQAVEAKATAGGRAAASTAPTAPGPSPVVARPAAPQPATAPGVRRVLPATGDPWSGLLQAGLSLLEQLAVAARSPSGRSAADGGPGGSGPAGLSIVRRDPETGEQYVRVPMPSPETLDRVLGVIGELLGGRRP